MIRPILATDLPNLRALIAGSGLFPPELLDGMLAPYLAGEAPGEIWLTTGAEAGGGIAYCAPERMTAGTWNLLLIAVAAGRQRQGLGGALLRGVEQRLAAAGARLLLVETSGLAEYDGPRAFYRSAGFAEEARIRDFYQPGEDKVVFRKPLFRKPLAGQWNTLPPSTV